MQAVYWKCMLYNARKIEQNINGCLHIGCLRNFFDIMYIQAVYDLDDQTKKIALGSVGVKWRQFKSSVAKKYVYPYADNPEKLKRPPQELSFIDPKDWSTFVSYRLSNQFKVINSLDKFYYYIVIT